MRMLHNGTVTRAWRVWCFLLLCAAAAQAQRFVILGDRTGSVQPGVYEQVWREVAAAKPEFVVTVGDTIEGLADAKAAGEWQEWQDIVKPYARIPLYLTPGNHDIWSDVSEALFRKNSGPRAALQLRPGRRAFHGARQQPDGDSADGEMAFLEVGPEGATRARR